MARRLGINEDTLKRSLHRNEIVQFDGAKYQNSRRNDTTKWTRPCLRCRSAKPRPKNQYICDRCKLNTLEHQGAPDGWNTF